MINFVKRTTLLILLKIISNTQITFATTLNINTLTKKNAKSAHLDLESKILETKLQNEHKYAVRKKKEIIRKIRLLEAPYFNKSSNSAEKKKSHKNLIQN